MINLSFFLSSSLNRIITHFLSLSFPFLSFPFLSFPFHSFSPLTSSSSRTYPIFAYLLSPLISSLSYPKSHLLSCPVISFFLSSSHYFSHHLILSLIISSHLPSSLLFPSLLFSFLLFSSLSFSSLRSSPLSHFYFPSLHFSLLTSFSYKLFAAYPLYEFGWTLLKQLVASRSMKHQDPSLDIERRKLPGLLSQ